MIRITRLSFLGCLSGSLVVVACGGSEFETVPAGSAGTTGTTGTGGSSAGGAAAGTGGSGAGGATTGKGGSSAKGGAAGKGGGSKGGEAGKGGDAGNGATAGKGGAAGTGGVGTGGAAGAGASGGSSAGPGVGGASTGGTGTTGGAGGTSTAGSSGSSGAGPGTGGTGSSCVEGSSMCVSDSAFTACTNGMSITNTCTAGFACDPDAVSPETRCKQPLATCTTPTAYFCSGATLEQCTGKFSFSTVGDCQSAQLCSLNQGGKCAVCTTQGELTCDGQNLLKCNITSQVTVAMCDATQKCNAGTGQCELNACGIGETRCHDGNVETCNATLSGWNVSQTCANGCGGTPPACLACMPGAAMCGPSGRMVCAQDGSQYQAAPCDPATPICNGAGDCVQCNVAADCVDPGPCVIVTGCAQNTCKYAQKPCGLMSMCCEDGTCSEKGHSCQ